MSSHGPSGRKSLSGWLTCYSQCSLLSDDLCIPGSVGSHHCGEPAGHTGPVQGCVCALEGRQIRHGEHTNWRTHTHSCWYHYLLEDYHSLSVLLHSLTLTLPCPYFTSDACAFWYGHAACVLRLAQSNNSDWMRFECGTVLNCWIREASKAPW